MIGSDFEDRLREQMRQATAGVSPPSGLVRRARRGRRRRLTARAAAAAAATAAAVTAVAVITGAVGAPQDAGTYTTAYVVGHVESALGAAAAADDIAYLHVPGNSSNMWFYSPLPRAAGAVIAHPHAPGGSTDVWLYNGPHGMITRIRDLSSQGQPISDVEGSVTSAGTTITRVNYPAKTWSRSRYPGSPPVLPPGLRAGCGDQVPLDLTAYYPPMLTANIRQALACGQLANKGTERVNGVDAIKLVSVRTLAERKGVTITTTTTIWVNSVNYLPVRWQFASNASASHQPGTQSPVDITWLAPTSANLARLTVQIPPGFTRVPARR
jgi:hypothetical protein